MLCFKTALCDYWPHNPSDVKKHAHGAGDHFAIILLFTFIVTWNMWICNEWSYVRFFPPKCTLYPPSKIINQFHRSWNRLQTCLVYLVTLFGLIKIIIWLLFYFNLLVTLASFREFCNCNILSWAQWRLMISEHFSTNFATMSQQKTRDFSKTKTDIFANPSLVRAWGHIFWNSLCLCWSE